MIWLALVAVVFVVGGAWLVTRSWLMRGIVFFAGLAAVIAYMVIGHPDMRDEPLAGRLAEVEKQARVNPESMTAAELMALAQKRAQEDPKSPMPHWLMGEILEASGQPNEAMLAYESALRRDPNHLPTIKNLADLRFKMSGQFDEATTALYHQVFAAEPDNWRVGYFAGIGDWQNGRKEQAEALWISIEARNPPPQMKQMFAAFQAEYGIVRFGQERPKTQRTPG